MRDIGTILWKEWKELVASEGRRSASVRLGFMVGILGILLPLQIGRPWVEARLGMAMAGWIPVMTIVAVIADSFAGERERRTLETLLASRLPDSTILFGKILAAVCYGMSIMLAMLAVSLMTVNVVYGNQGFLMFSLPDMAGILVFGVLTSLLATGAGVLVSLRSPTVRYAQQILSVAAILLVFLPLFIVPSLPDSVRTFLTMIFSQMSLFALAVLGAGALLLLDAALIVAALARFRRNRLIL
jgi:ABC-2 type transport system permease protein